MRLRLLSFAALYAVGLVASAQTDPVDITNTLQNADFAADEPVSAFVCTYDYDMEANGTTFFGMQPVIGWVASSPSDNIAVPKDTRTDGANAKAAGVFAFGSDNAFLGGSSYMAPLSGPDGNDGQALGFIAVWGAKAQYTQDVTLPAGAYRIVIPTCNVAGTTAVSANLCGFQTNDGETYFSKKLQWEMVGEWENDTIEFLLKEEAQGAISIGYTAGNAGSGGMPHLFFDGIQLFSIDPAPLI